MKSYALLALTILMTAATLRAQADQYIVRPILSKQLQSPQVVTYQLQKFLEAKVPALNVPASAGEWTSEAERIRRHLLDDVVFHGWPRERVNSPPHFEDLGPLAAGKGYTLHKLRYELVPGFYSTALLYAPENLQGRVPAVLDVMGHFADGNKEEFEQKLCIKQALKGMIALNPEWLDMGDLNTSFNDHGFGSHLDLVGMSGVGLFYLSMRRALDYLAADPRVDPTRLGVTGLSGGGWETITISSLDPRVYVSVPVAGYVNLQGRLERLPEEPGDFEQLATDFLAGQDYSTMTAIRAPKPTLLIYNAEDDCCFRAPLVKPYVFDPVVPFYLLYGKANAFQFYQSTLISAHNYGFEDQTQALAFFVKHFHLAVDSTEMPVGQYVKSYDELKGGIPNDNLTILALAQQEGKKLTRTRVPAEAAELTAWAESQRAKLRDVVRYHPVTVSQIMRVTNTYHDQVESLAFRFELSNGLSAAGVWLKDVKAGDHVPLTMMISDSGKKGGTTDAAAHYAEVAHCLERGEQVLTLDVLGIGDAAPDQPYDMMAQLLAATGERPLGMDAAQLIGVTRWAQQQWTPSQTQLRGTGIRSQVIALVASSLEPRLFSQVELNGGMPSLGYLLEAPIKFESAPELFCLDLYKEFDLDTLTALAKPAEISQHGFVELPAPAK